MTNRSARRAPLRPALVLLTALAATLAVPQPASAGSCLDVENGGVYFDPTCGQGIPLPDCPLPPPVGPWIACIQGYVEDSEARGERIARAWVSDVRELTSGAVRILP